MSKAFRPLVTAASAGILLSGVYFIPSAHAQAPAGAPRHTASKDTERPGTAPLPAHTPTSRPASATGE